MKIKTKQMIAEKHSLSVGHQNRVRYVTSELSAVTSGSSTGYSLCIFVSMDVPIAQNHVN